MLTEEPIVSFERYLLSVKSYSLKTLEAYTADLQSLRAYAAQIDEGLTWETLDSDFLRRYIVWRMQTKVSPATLSRFLSSVRSFYRYRQLIAIANGERICKNPADGLQPPRAEHKLVSIVKEQELEQLFSLPGIFPKTSEGQRDKTILLLLYSTGMRSQEMLDLRLCDIDFGACVLSVIGKGRKMRRVPFGKELRDVLEGYIARQFPEAARSAEQCLFSLTYFQLRAIVRHYLSLVSTASKRSPHVLRHSYASTLLTHGASLSAIQSLLGHESIRTTEAYTHLSPAALQANYAKAHPRATEEKDDLKHTAHEDCRKE